MQKYRELLKKPKYYVPVGLFVFIVLVIAFSGGSNKAVNDTVVVQKSDMVQEVSVTGKVKPAHSVELAFERSGKVSFVNGKIGDAVRAGQTLVSLVSSDIGAQVSQASAGTESIQANIAQYEAALAREQVKLEELKRGTRPEEISIAQTSVDNAKIVLADVETNLKNIQTKADEDLANAYADVPDVLNDALVKADDAVRRQTDPMFFSDYSSMYPQLTFQVPDSQLESDIERKRAEIISDLSMWADELRALSTSTTVEILEKAIRDSKTYLVKNRDFLEMLNNAVNRNANLSAATLLTYQTNLTAARTSVNTAMTGITTQEQIITSQKITNQNAVFSAQSKVNDAKNTLASAQNQLTLKQAGATQDQISAQEAQVRQAEANINSQKALLRQSWANVANYQAQWAKTVIRAPIDGVITQQDAKIGEIVTANKPVVSLISAAEFEIETDVPEADVAKLKLENPARVTLDAYGSDVNFEAKVTKIDPAETIIDGVATYKTTLQFVSQDERIRSGMTANIDITTDSRQGVLAIPVRAILSENGDKFVLLLKNPESKNKAADAIKTEVTVGLRSSDGKIEILEGVNENDTLLIPSD